MKSKKMTKFEFNRLLTATYRELLKYVVDKGYPPTIKELSVILGISKYAVVKILKVLTDANKIKRTPKTARGIKLLDVSLVEKRGGSSNGN